MVGGSFKREGTYVYLRPIHVDISETNTIQKTIILELLFINVMYYKVVMNTELANTKLLLLEEIHD